MTTMQPQVIGRRDITLELCVPKTWTDQEVEAFAAAVSVTGVKRNWKIREIPIAHPTCSNDSSHVHVTLDA